MNKPTGKTPRKKGGKATPEGGGDGHIEDTLLDDALSERFLSYALSTIVSRSLPDVRDGLKPVQRRILYAMHQLGLAANSGYKKSARVVGDVVGKFHPHGEQAVYDALVRMAQDFSMRLPLVDGQGNFGNIDGDNAAAFRYTETRLTAAAEALLEGINEDAIDFLSTYDGEEKEPVVMPARLPNLLANGTSGIAVGMATSIPPHNLGELIDALLHLIKTPNATIAKLVSYVKGPDFPTGGVLVEEPESILEAYKIGRGSFRLRAKWEVEPGSRGVYRIIVTEIPFQVQKSRLIEKIAEIINGRNLPILADVYDESDESIRLVLEPRNRSVVAEVLMEQLFRQTDLETRFSLNLNVLHHGQVPQVMNLREALQAFIDHRVEVLVRVTKYRLERVEHRLLVLDGYLVAYLNIDEVIRIIREEDDPKAVMMKKFKLSDVQVEAILNMRLRSLRRLEEIEIKSEHTELEAEAKEIRSLLESKKKQDETIAADLKALKKDFGADCDRRTEIAEAPDVEDVFLDDMIEKEPITVIISKMGWIKAARGHIAPDAEVKYKDGDGPRFRFHASTTDKLLIFATNGRFYTLGCDKLPGGRGNGEPLRLMFDMGNDQEIVSVTTYAEGAKYVIAASDGRGFVVPADQILASTRGGKQALNVKGDIEAQACAEIGEGHDHVAVVGENHKLLIFALDELPEMTRGRGNILQKYKDGGLSDLTTFNLASGLSWPQGTQTRTDTEVDDWIGKRSGAGRMAPRGFPKSNRFTREG